MSERKRKKLKEEIVEKIEEGRVSEFVHIVQTIKVAFDYHSDFKTSEAVEVLEEAKEQIRDLQAALLKGLPNTKMFEMQLGGQQGFDRQASPRWTDEL